MAIHGLARIGSARRGRRGRSWKDAAAQDRAGMVGMARLGRARQNLT